MADEGNLRSSPLMHSEDLSTRALAARTLQRVMDEGAYSNVLVARQETADTVDRGLYQRLVFESIRYLPAVDEAIERAASRSIDRIQADVLSVLRIGTTEMRYLRRPAHSAVSESVEAIRELGRNRAVGFVNGVLRAVARQVGEPVPSDARDGMPLWLHDRLVAVFGDDAGAFIVASNTPPLTGIRSRDGDLRGDVTAVPGTGYVRHDINISNLVTNEVIDVIDPASVAVVEALEVASGDMVVDLAAAPGGKTRIIAERCGPNGMVIAVDRHERRLRSARKRLKSTSNVEWILADAASAPLRDAAFDKALLDAPCTGLGSLRRRPEIRHRIEPDAPERYGSFQRAMLTEALRLIRPGGRLVYSVCTVFPEETIDVVAGLGAHSPRSDVGMPWGDGVLLAPHITGTDGMFIAVLDR